MKFFKYILFFVLLVTSMLGWAQTANKWKFISKEQARLFIIEMRTWVDKHPNYSVDLNYYSYKTYADLSPADKSIGYFKKNGENISSLNVGIKNIQNAVYRVAIDTTQKIILIGNPRKSGKSVADIDTAQLMSKVEKFSSFSTEDESGLKIEFKKNPTIGSIEIYIGKNGEIKRMVWYYSGRVTNIDVNDKDNNVLPKVEVVYSNYKLNTSFDYKKEFDEKQFFTIKDKVFVPTQKYKDYKVRDTRIAKH